MSTEKRWLLSRRRYRKPPMSNKLTPAGLVRSSAVVRGGDGEAVGGQANRDGLRVPDELAAVLAQRLSRVDIAGPRFAVRIGNETRHVQLVARGPQHRQGAVRAVKRQTA